MERNIKYQYFKMDVQDKLNGIWTNSREFNFIEWIQYVSDNNLEKETIELKDTKARIEKIKFFTDQDVWVVRFMKLREENLPYLAKERKDASDIPLQDDEYIGEDMYMLYDIGNKIAMIQSNRFSLGLTRLTELLMKSQNKTDERVRLWPIKKYVDVTALNKMTYRTLELGFANIVREVPKKNSALADILNTFRKFSGVSGTIKIGIGRAKDDSLDIVEVDKVISEIKECDNIVSARIKIRDDDASRTEIVDLLDECYCDIITYKLEPRTTLEFNNAATSMVAKYMKVRDKLVSLTTVPIE